MNISICFVFSHKNSFSLEFEIIQILFAEMTGTAPCPEKFFKRFIKRQASFLAAVSKATSRQNKGYLLIVFLSHSLSILNQLIISNFIINL